MAAAVVIANLALGVASSSAAVSQPLLFSFNGSGTPAGSFTPYGVAIDQSNGNVLVPDLSNSVVNVFNSSGKYLSQYGTGAPATPRPVGVAVDNTCEYLGVTGSACTAADAANGDVYVTDHSNPVLDVYGPSGTGTYAYLRQIALPGAPLGVAVDQGTGDVWVSTSVSEVFEYSPTGTQLNEITGTTSGTTTVPFTSTWGVAVDPTTGAVYVADPSNHVVDKFSSSGVYESQLTGTPSGAFNQPYIGLAVDPLTGELYVGDLTTGSLDEFDSSGDFITAFQLPNNVAPTGFAVSATTGDVYVASAPGHVVDVYAPTGPDVITGSGSSVTTTGATIAATVNPDGNAITGCHFEYGTGTSYGQTAPCSPSTPSGSSPVTVSADLTGLIPGSVYHFQLVVTSSQGTTGGGDATFTTPGASVTGESASDVGTTSATLLAGINPNGQDTTYHFEYGTADCATSTCTKIPAADVDIGSGSTVERVNQTLSGLAAGTTYHYRVVATNSAGTTDGPDQTFTTASTTAGCPNSEFRTGYSASLPDCRADERVSPPGTRPYISSSELGTLGVSFEATQAASSGNGLSWFSYYPSAGSASSGMYYLSTRESSGWATKGMIPPQSQLSADDSRCAPDVFYSADLSTDVLQDGFNLGNGTSCGSDDPALVPGEPQNGTNLFLHDTAGGAYRLLNSGPASSGLANAQFEDATPDFADLLFEDPAQLTPNAPAGGGLYESNGASVSFVSVLPNGTAVSGVLANAPLGQFIGSAPFTGAVSSDGSRIFFQANGNLYVRVNADGTQVSSPPQGATCLQQQTDACTVQVDASQAGGSGGGGSFAWASSAEVFFTDDASAGLTANTVSGSGTNLYEFDTQTGALSDLTPVAGAQVQAVAGASQDGSYVYFFANGALTDDATPGDCGRSSVTGSYAGSCNLYIYHAGATSLIATLPASDGTDWGFDNVGVPSDALTSVTSPNGRLLEFESTASLTGYDNVPANAAACQLTGGPSGAPCAEIYLYDASSGTLSCVSCDPSGTPPTAAATVPSFEQMEGLVAQGPGYQQRSVLDDGRVFFNSPDALLPAASDGQSNVYEFEPPGVGSCVQPTGCLALISSGSSSDGSFFYDASASGNDVFFISTQDLAGTDTGGIETIFDARVDGGFPAAATQAPVCADAQSCHGSTVQPAAPNAATVSFSGPGNQSSSTARVTGKVRVMRSTVRGNPFAITVKTPSAGRITISGGHVRGVARRVARAGSYRVLVRLTRSAAKALSRGHRLSVELQVRFAPGSGSASLVRVRMTVAAKAAKHRSATRTRRAGHNHGGVR